jgi:hypothetical protein
MSVLQQLDDNQHQNMQLCYSTYVLIVTVYNVVLTVHVCVLPLSLYSLCLFPQCPLTSLHSILITQHA